MVECAMAILKDGEKVKEKFGGGGLLTSACLADQTGLVEQMRGNGWGIEVEELK